MQHGPGRHAALLNAGMQNDQEKRVLLDFAEVHVIFFFAMLKLWLG